MHDVPDHVLLPTQATLTSPEEEQKDVRYVDANRTKETLDNSTGDYNHITVWKLPCFLINSVQIMHTICRKNLACYPSQNLA